MSLWRTFRLWTQQYVEYKKQHPLNYEKLLAKDTKRILQYLKRQHYNIGLASSSTMTAIQEVLNRRWYRTLF